MKKIILFSLITILTFNFASAQKRQIETAKKPVSNANQETKKYVMVFLNLNNQEDNNIEKSAELVTRHKEFLTRLNEEGFLLMEGTFEDEGSLKEILLLNTTEFEEAKSRFAEDPAVKDGMYTIEYRQFITKNNTIKLE